MQIIISTLILINKIEEIMNFFLRFLSKYGFEYGEELRKNEARDRGKQYNLMVFFFYF